MFDGSFETCAQSLVAAWYIFTQLLHEFGYFLCSSTEFIVVIERAVACRLLRK